MKRGQPNTILGWVVVSLLAYGILFIILRPHLEPETWEPGEIAAHLLSGEGYSLHRFSGFVQPSANQEPAYTLLLAFFLAVFPHPYIFLMIFQVACWMVCAALIGWLARRLIGAPQNWTALIVSLWPPLAIYVLTYHPLWLRSWALVLVIAAALYYKDEPRLRRAFLLGLALGFAALTRAPFLLLPVIISPWIAWSGRREKRPVLLEHAALCLAVAALVLSPWVIRNRLILGGWVAGTTTAGYTAIIGNHPGATGALDGTSLRRATAHLQPKFWHQPEVERDAAFRGAVAEFWQTHISEALVLYVKKLVYLWTWRPGVGSLYPGGWTVVYLVGWSLCLPLILVGWWLARKDPRAEAPNLFLVLWIVYSVVYAFFAVNMRFRFETEPLLVPYLIVAVRGIARRFHKCDGSSYNEASRRGGPMLRTILVMAAILSSWTIHASQTPSGEPTVDLPVALARVLTDYETAWENKDAAALSVLFTEDGFVLPNGRPPVRGRENVESYYDGKGGPLSLRAIAFAAEGNIGYIIGGYALRKDEPDVGKFTLTLRKSAGGRWLIVSDMDSVNRRRE